MSINVKTEKSATQRYDPSRAPIKRKIIEETEAKAYGITDFAPNGYFEAYVSMFGNLDRQGEIVQRGAYAKSLPKFIKKGFSVFSHQWGTLAIGWIHDAIEDEKGLRLIIPYHGYQSAQDCRLFIAERIAAGKDVQFSVGYRVIEAEDTPAGRLLKELEVFEASPVNMAANPETYAITGKFYDGEFSIEQGELYGVDNFLSMMSMDEHFKQVNLVNEGFIDRVKDIRDLRLQGKQGRTLNSANVSRLQTLRDRMSQGMAMIDEILASNDRAEVEANLPTATSQKTDNSGEIPHLENPTETVINAEPGEINPTETPTPIPDNTPVTGQEKTISSTSIMDSALATYRELLANDMVEQARQLGVEILD